MSIFKLDTFTLEDGRHLVVFGWDYNYDILEEKGERIPDMHSTDSDFIQFLCTGKTNSPELQERFESLFPSAVPQRGCVDLTERGHRPATLGTNTRRA